MTAVLACMWSAVYFADVREEELRWARSLWGREVGIT